MCNVHCNVGGLFPYIPVVSPVGSFLFRETLSSVCLVLSFLMRNYFFIVIVLVLLLWRAISLKRNRMILAWVTVPVGWRDGAALLLHLGAECHSSWLMSCKKYVYTRSDPKAEGLKWEPPVPTPLLWTEWLPLSPTCVDTVAGAGVGSPYALAGKQLTCHVHTQLCLWPTSANQAT